MPEMISKVAHVYDGHQLTPGERFSADQDFVAALVGLGRAELAPIQQNEAEPYCTREINPAPMTEYQRLDLRAQPSREKRKFKRSKED